MARRTTPPTRERPRAPRGLLGRTGQALVACVLGVAVSGCVTYDVEPERPVLDPESVAPVTIPLRTPAEDPEQRAITEYHRSIVTQLQDAAASRDVPLLRALLARHDRAASPDWFRDSLDTYRRLASALEFELHAVEASTLDVRTPEAAIGEALVFEVTVPTATRPDLVVPGEDADVASERFLVSVAVFDHDCFGDHTVRRSAQLLPVRESVALGKGEALTLPFALPALAPEGCVRRVTLDVDWMPGNLLFDDGPVPHNRFRVARRTFEFFPRGIEIVRKNPYTNLKRALELGEARYFDHVFLAARFMPEPYREDAMRKLVNHLRVARPDLARVCTAALAELSDEDITVGDRDAWLEWWGKRSGPR